MLRGETRKACAAKKGAVVCPLGQNYLSFSYIAAAGSDCHNVSAATPAKILGPRKCKSEMNSSKVLAHRPLRMHSAGLIFLVLAGALLAGCNATKVASNPTSTQAQAATLSAGSTSLNFGNVAVGSSKTLPLTLSNGTGQSASIQVSQFSVSGSAFHASGVALPITLAAGQSAIVNVAFQPLAGGATSGTISISSTAANPLLTLSLSGTGLAAGQLGVSPASMNFGNVTVGSSQSQTGTLTAGSSSVVISSSNWTGNGFSLSGLSFPVTLQAGQSVPFTVTFTPQLSGSVTGSVSFLSNATNSPGNETWSGNGVQPAQHSVSLSWNPDPSGVQGYYVYRGGQSGGPYTRISPLLPAASYTDSNVVSAQTYYYVVTALGTNSIESGYSNQAVATIP